MRAGTHPANPAQGAAASVEEEGKKKLWKRAPARPAKVLMVVLSVLSLPFLVVYIFVYIAYCVFLYAAVWLCWLHRGKDVFFVYSNSPHWKDYVETAILPRIADKAILANWSERSTWGRWSLPALCFRHFGGTRDFNPMGVVFRPFRRARVFRFYQAFQDQKHGKLSALEETEDKFFEYIRTPL